MTPAQTQEIAGKIISDEMERGGLIAEHDTAPLREAIVAALVEAERCGRLPWMPLYRLALEYQMQHDAIMYAWRDKASPDAIKRLEALRPSLFAACRHAREKSGLTKETIEDLVGPIGADTETK